jgi:hypothetical protein
LNYALRAGKAKMTHEEMIAKYTLTIETYEDEAEGLREICADILHDNKVSINGEHLRASRRLRQVERYIRQYKSKIDRIARIRKPGVGA